MKRHLKQKATLVAVVLLAAALSACTTLTPAGPPPMVKRGGSAPVAAMLPWYTHDSQLAGEAYDKLQHCLAARNVFRFVPRSSVEKAISKHGIDINRTFGISEKDAKLLASELKADYVLGGAFNVVKSLKFTGFRKDIASDLRIYRGKDGELLHTLRSNTSLTFSGSDTDQRKMMESAMNHLCSEVMDYSF